MEKFNSFKSRKNKIAGKDRAEKLLPTVKDKKFDDAKQVKGVIEGNERGFAFLLPEDGGEDFFISHSDLNGAEHGDVVIVKVKEETERRTTARVYKILERKNKIIVGTFSACKSGGFVIADDKKYFSDVYVPYKLSKKAKTGDKVVCEIKLYVKGSNPEGEIVEVLGRQFSRRAEVKSVAVANNIELDFKKEVLDEAERVALPVSKKDLITRRDLRSQIVVTIDGEDAKDFDDAISVVKAENGDYILGVHIADVSEYVKEGSLLDASAFERGTSVYFPEMVIPMLPERLSNDVCSLMPNVDRLTLSCVMRINSKGEVVDSEIFPSIINSKARLTYSLAKKVLDGEETDVDKSIQEMIITAGELANILIAKRDKRGSIDLDVKEAKITVSKKGKVTVDVFERNFAHKLIEEFMICANETVAEYAYYLGLPFIYRIHEKPVEDKIIKLMDFLKGLGLNRKWHADNVYPKDFQALLGELKEGKSPLAPLVNRVMLRSMQKAKYSPENVGHFGLASKCYSHFTSPIRRYPDLAIHRVLKAFFKGEENIEERYAQFVSSASTQSGNKERGAETAERAVDDYYKMLYMSDHVGEEFTGVISGVQNFGIFVELPSTVEGIVKVDTILGKDFKYDELNYTLFNKNRSFKLGQIVEIVVVGVDMGNKRAEFMLKDDYLNCKK